MISPSSTNEKVTEIGDYIFRVCFIDPFQGSVMAKFASGSLHLGRIAILRDVRSDYSIGLSDVFQKTFTSLGGTISANESYQQGDQDFRAPLTALKASSPEAIYVPGYYTDVALIARQARELGIKVPLMGGDGWDSPKLFEIGGKAIEGSFFSNHYSYEDPSPRIQDFVKKYKERFGQVPDGLAATGYDAARLAFDAMGRAKDGSSEALRDAIEQTKGFEGVTGIITIDPDHNAVKPAVVLEIKGGAGRYVATVTPDQPAPAAQPVPAAQKQ
jgi:branched-chain amino acid transport system substrate-binding protein